MAVDDSQDTDAGAGADDGGSAGKRPRMRKMSRSEMIGFDATSGSETQSEVVLEDDEDLYN